MGISADEVNYNLIEYCCKSDPDVCAALEILISLQDLMKSMENRGTSCSLRVFSTCFGKEIRKIMDSYRTSKGFQINNLSTIVKHKLEEIPSYMSKTQTIIDAFLNWIHCCSCNISSKNISNQGCDCPSHSVCGLEIKETFKCECGEKEIYAWDTNNFFIYFNFSNFFEHVQKSGVLKDARFSNHNILKLDITTKLSFSETMIEFLKAVILKAEEKSCPDPSCMLKSSKVSFSLEKNPEILFIAFKNLEESNRLTCFVSISSINLQFDIGELFKDSQEIYELYGIIFENQAGSMIYVYQSIQGWVMGGKRKNWDEIVINSVKNKLKTSLIIYKKRQVYSRLAKSITKSKTKLGKHQNINQNHLLRKSSSKNLIVKNDFRYVNQISGSSEGNSSDLESSSSKKLESVGSSDLKKTLANSYDVGSIKIEQNEESKDLKSQKFNSNKNDYNPLIKKRREVDKNIEVQKPLDSFSETRIKERENQESQELDEWICKCSAKNSSSFEVCIKCKLIKPGLNGWVCDICTFRNDETEYRCNSCFTFKHHISTPLSSEKGKLWVCYGCMAWNNPEREFCSHCRIERPDDD